SRLRSRGDRAGRPDTSPSRCPPGLLGWVGLVAFPVPYTVHSTITGGGVQVFCVVWCGRFCWWAAVLACRGVCTLSPFFWRGRHEVPVCPEERSARDRERNRGPEPAEGRYLFRESPCA